MVAVPGWLTTMLECGLIFLTGLVGGFLPLLVLGGERRLHAALGLATGILLGAVFLHLLPSLSALEAEDGAAGGGGALPAHGGLWLYVLAGVLGVALLESTVLRSHDFDDEHRHRAVGFAVFLGLAVHSLVTGIAYAATEAEPSLEEPVLLAIVAHKGFEAFSLTSMFQLAGVGRGRIAALVVLFSLVTPFGVLVGDSFAGSLGPRGLGILTAAASGTFLYVCLSELLPEVFHHREDVGLKVTLLAVGVALMALVQ